MKKKLLKSLRVLIVAAGLCAGAGAWAKDTEVTCALTRTVNIVGAGQLTADNLETYDVTTVYVNKYKKTYGVGVLEFELDNNFNASKVKSAQLQLYVTSMNTSRDYSLYIYEGSTMVSLADGTANLNRTKKSDDEKAVVYSYGGDNTNDYSIGGTELSSTHRSSLTNTNWNNFDVTTYIQGLTSESAGDKITFGLKAAGSNPASAIYIGGMGHTNAAKLVITYTDETLYTANFTENNSLKPTVTIYSDEEMTSEVNNGTLVDKTTYYYKAVLTGYRDATGSFTVSGANPSISFTMTAKETYTYHLYYKLGSADAVEQASNTLYEDEIITLYYPVCRQDASGNYYTVGKNGSTPYFGVILSSENREATINYTLDEDIVYYAEAENMGGSRYSAGQGGSYASGGAAYCSANSTNSYIATNWSITESGIYNIEVGMANRSYSVNPTPKLMTSSDDASPTNLDAISLSASSYTQKTYSNQQIAAEQQLYVFNDNGSNASKWALDYVILRKANVTATIGSTGYATFSSTSPLDFTSVTDATAYIATSKSGDNIQMQAVTGAVTAGTGLVLKSASGSSATVTIPVAVSGTTYNTESDPKNYLFAISSDYNLNKSNNGTNYVLSVQSGKVVFAPIEDVAAPVTAGHAALWLPADVASQARSLRLSFDEETTGISMLQGENAIDNGCFNLSGQRVAQPSRGLYIVGGKKVIVK